MGTTGRRVTTGRQVVIGIALLVLIAVAAISSWPSGVRPTEPPASATATTTSPGTTPGATTQSSEPVESSPTSAAPATRAPATGEAVAVLVGAGDIADCSSDRDSATADLLKDIPGTVFTLGDNAYESGSAAEFANCYGPTWGRRSILRRTRPAPGNHEYITAGAAGYFGYFGTAAGDPSKGYYAYDAGAWRIYALNSNCEVIGGCETGSPQERWLRADLDAEPRACVAAMWHHPRFSSGPHGNEPIMRDLWQTLQDAGAELVLAGHDHTYERFAAQTAAGRADPAGIVELVVGTGGRSSYAFETIRDNSLVRKTGIFGVVRLTLRASSYRFEFVPIAGESFTDSGSADCH